MIISWQRKLFHNSKSMKHAKFLFLFLIPLLLTTACSSHRAHPLRESTTSARTTPPITIRAKPTPASSAHASAAQEKAHAPTAAKANKKLADKKLSDKHLPKKPHPAKEKASPKAPIAHKSPSRSEKEPMAKVEKKREIIVLDAGHGGKDKGASSQKSHYEEKVLTLKTARLVKGYLESLGYPVILTRSSDVFLSLEERAELANTTGATLFISIHYNTAPDPKAEGVEVFYYKDDKEPKAHRLLSSKRLGESVLSTVVKHTGASPRGVKRANFAVIRKTQMPAILIEAGFLTNPKERDRIKSEAYLRYLSWGIAKGINCYLTPV